MIYIIIAAVLGFAAWQLVNVVRRTKAGGCASGCSGCGQNGQCGMQSQGQNQRSSSQLLQIEEVVK